MAFGPSQTRYDASNHGKGLTPRVVVILDAHDREYLDSLIMAMSPGEFAARNYAQKCGGPATTLISGYFQRITTGELHDESDRIVSKMIGEAHRYEPRSLGCDLEAHINDWIYLDQTTFPS